MRFRQIQRSQGVERIERPLPWNPTLALGRTRSFAIDSDERAREFGSG